MVEFDASTHSERERRQGMITRECLTEILGTIRANGVAFELERLQRVVESKAVRHMLHVSSNVVQLFQAHDQYAMCVCVQCAIIDTYVQDQRLERVVLQQHCSERLAALCRNDIMLRYDITRSRSGSIHRVRNRSSGALVRTAYRQNQLSQPRIDTQRLRDLNESSAQRIVLEIQRSEREVLLESMADDAGARFEQSIPL